MVSVLDILVICIYCCNHVGATLVAQSDIQNVSEDFTWLNHSCTSSDHALSSKTTDQEQNIPYQTNYLAVTHLHSSITKTVC